MKVVLNSDNLTGALTNASGQVNINIYSDNNGSLGDKLFTADNVDFADLTEEFNNYSFNIECLKVFKLINILAFVLNVLNRIITFLI